MKVPFVDLKAQYNSIKTEIDLAMKNVMGETAFIGGSSNKYVTNFEKEFSNYLGLKHVIACANGTDSIEILLEAYNIKAGDEVIVPALSWISTSEAVGRVGAKSVFVDVCEDTLLMDLDLIEAKINQNTRAIIPVHLYGNALNMERLMQIAAKHNLIVIEDCAQAHGAKYNNKLVGTYGHAASFSFYPGKNLGAYGDAGCMTTNDIEIADKCRMIANHGQLVKHKHVMEGRNSRLDGLHAAVLSVKLNYLDNWNTNRNKVAGLYKQKVSNNLIQLPVVNENAYHVYHLYVIRCDDREKLKKVLDENQIENAIHYPTALPFLEAYKKYNYQLQDYPVAYSQTNRIISIPIFPELSDEQLEHVVAVLNKFSTH